MADAGADALISPISEKMSPRSAYLHGDSGQAKKKKTISTHHTVKDRSELVYLDVFDTESVGLCNGAYGCDAVGVDEFEAPGL